MSAGYGLQGTGRCYPLWRDFTMCKNASSNPGECVPFFEDYVTCNYGWTHPTNLELHKRQVAVAEEQNEWRKKYGKKMSAHVRTFRSEAEYNEWKEQLIAEQKAAGKVTVLESDASMEQLRAFTKEKLNL